MLDEMWRDYQKKGAHSSSRIQLKAVLARMIDVF